MENTLWNVNRDGNFMELFKNSFTLYVESGMREKTEADIRVTDIWKNEWQGNIKEMFCMFIIKHYLCKFHCF